MKKIFICLLVMFCTHLAQAQSEKYIAAMKINLSQIEKGYQTPGLFLKLSDNFERIAKAENNQWLPYYYSALMLVNHSFTLKDFSTLDPVMDEATQLLNKADSLQPQNSEISCVRMMVATVQMLVDPQQRYMVYMPEIEKQYLAAVQQDSSNPRPHYLKGENIQNTPEQFGGGCEAAKAELSLAREKFARFSPASPLMPNWGKERVDQLLAMCNEK